MRTDLGWDRRRLMSALLPALGGQLLGLGLQTADGRVVGVAEMMLLRPQCGPRGREQGLLGDQRDDIKEAFEHDPLQEARRSRQIFNAGVVVPQKLAQVGPRLRLRVPCVHIACCV